MTFSVEIPITLINVVGDLRPDVVAWCRANLKSTYEFVLAEWPPARHTIYFVSDDDAALFKLFWI